MLVVNKKKSLLVSLKDARAAVDKDPLRGVAMYKRASEWELQVIYYY